MFSEVKRQKNNIIIIIQPLIYDINYVLQKLKEKKNIL